MLHRLDSVVHAVGIQDSRGPAKPAAIIKRVRRLTPAERAELVAQYQSGLTVYQLADKYGIHRHTVSKHLRAAGVRLRLDGLTAEQIDEAVQLYASGWSLARIAARFDVTSKTVQARLRERGVSFRDTHGRDR